MAHTFAGNEWIDAFWNELRADEATRRAAATWVHGPAVLVIDAQDDKHFPETVALRIHTHEGETREVRKVDADAADRSPFVFTAPYERWKLVAQGKLDVIEALLNGVVRFKGDLPTVMRHADMLAAFAAAAARVDTEFPDEVAAAAEAEAATAR